MLINLSGIGIVYELCMRHCDCNDRDNFEDKGVVFVVGGVIIIVA